MCIAPMLLLSLVVLVCVYCCLQYTVLRRQFFIGLSTDGPLSSRTPYKVSPSSPFQPSPLLRRVATRQTAWRKLRLSKKSMTARLVHTTLLLRFHLLQLLGGKDHCVSISAASVASVSLLSSLQLFWSLWSVNV